MRSSLGLLVSLGTFVLSACSGESRGRASSDAGPIADADTITTGLTEGGTSDGSGASGAADAPNAGEDSPSNASCAITTTRGAALPYQEYQAESGSTNGTVIGPSRAVDDADLDKSIAGESSGRRAVKLTATGQFVRFTTACDANSVVVRYVVPDSADGSGMTATLGLYVNGTRVRSLPLTSRYSWAYGNPNATDATTNTPSDGHARHFYDEVRALLPATVPAGSTIALQRDDSDSAAYYVVDLADLEQVAPALARPANTLSVADYGAMPDDGIDDGQGIQKCMDAAKAQGKGVWIPPGTYDDGSTALVAGSGVTVQGAGMWRTTIQGASAYFECTAGPCTFSDFALSGDVTLRNDATGVHAFLGSFGTGSRIENVWVEHFTTGPWIGQGGAPASQGLVVKGCRFRDLFADGLNVNTGASMSSVTQCHARNTGDDGFASWSNGSGSNTGNVFQFDTAELPWRANCFAIYGGTDNAVEDSTCFDVVTYPGIFVDQEFNSSPFSGTTLVARDSIVRAGGGMYGVQWGALTVDGNQAASPIQGVDIKDVDIESATYSGIYLLGASDSIQGLQLTNVDVVAPGTYGIDIDSTAKGSSTAAGVVVTSPGSGLGLRDQAGAAFTLIKESGDVGW